ncbi:MAG: hypothetical protein WA231_05170 [Methylocella sp.]
MRIRDMMAPSGRIYLKSEWNQISDDWPCVSFTKKSVGDRLRAGFSPGRDVLIYVGTTNSEMTEDPDHRGRLISVVVIQPKQILATRKIVPPDVWRKAGEKWGDRWPHAMAVTRAANLVGPPYPDAHNVIPSAYRSFAEIANRGSVVQAIGAERDRVMDLEVEEIELHLSGDVRRYLNMMDALEPSIDKTVEQEAVRMATLIQERVRIGGEVSARINPQRTAPNMSDLVTVLIHKWKTQKGQCMLCSGNLVAGTQNGMLRTSPDRIDSSNGAYNEENVQLTHLACNLAKNEYGPDQFREWLDVVRGEDAT